MNWVDLLQKLGTFAIASGLLLWAIKSLVSQSLARDIEKFKADLRSTSFEHETRFARLHETRAQIITELYKRLVQTEEAIRSLLLRDTGEDFPEVADDEKIEKLHSATGKKIWDLERFFDEHRLYFDDELRRLMGLHVGNFAEAWLSGSPSSFQRLVMPLNPRWTAVLGLRNRRNWLSREAAKLSVFLSDRRVPNIETITWAYVDDQLSILCSPVFSARQMRRCLAVPSAESVLHSELPLCLQEM